MAYEIWFHLVGICTNVFHAYALRTFKYIGSRSEAQKN
jgi:hypothetical protein